MKTVKTLINNIYYILILEIVQDINKSYKNRVVRYVLTTWILGLMCMAVIGIVYMIYMIFFSDQIISMAF